MEDASLLPEPPLELQVCTADQNGFDASPLSDDCSHCSPAQFSGRLSVAVGCGKRQCRGTPTEDLFAELQRERALRLSSEAELSRFVDKLQRTTQASIEQQVGTILSQVEDELRARCRAVDDLVAEVSARHMAGSFTVAGGKKNVLTSTQAEGSELYCNSPLLTTGSSEYGHSALIGSVCSVDGAQGAQEVQQQLQALQVTVRSLEETSKETSTRLHDMTGKVEQLQAEIERRAAEIQDVRRSQVDALRAAAATTGNTTGATPRSVRLTAPACAGSNAALQAPLNAAAVVAPGRCTPSPRKGGSEQHALSRTVSPVRAASASKLERRGELDSEHSGTLYVSGLNLTSQLSSPFRLRSTDHSPASTGWALPTGQTSVRTAAPDEHRCGMRDSLESARTTSPKTMRWSLSVPSIPAPGRDEAAVSKRAGSSTSLCAAKPASLSTIPVMHSVTAPALVVTTLPGSHAAAALSARAGAGGANNASGSTGVARAALAGGGVAGGGGATAPSAASGSAALPGAVSASVSAPSDAGRRLRTRSLSSQPLSARCHGAQQGLQLLPRSASGSGITAALQQSSTPPVPPLQLSQVRSAAVVHSARGKPVALAEPFFIGAALAAAPKVAMAPASSRSGACSPACPRHVTAPSLPVHPTTSLQGFREKSQADPIFVTATAVPAATNGSRPRSESAGPTDGAQASGPAVIPIHGNSPVFGATPRGPASCAAPVGGGLKRLSLSGGSGAGIGGGAGSSTIAPNGLAAQQQLVASRGSLVVPTSMATLKQVPGTFAVTRSASAPSNSTAKRALAADSAAGPSSCLLRPMVAQPAIAP